MTPEKPAPEAQAGVPTAQAAVPPAPAGPQRLRPPAAPDPIAAPAPRKSPEILVRACILAGAVLITYFCLGYLSLLGDMFARYVISRPQFENFRIKPGPTPAASRVEILRHPHDPSIVLPPFPANSPDAASIANSPRQTLPAVPPTPTPTPQTTPPAPRDAGN